MVACRWRRREDGESVRFAVGCGGKRNQEDCAWFVDLQTKKEKVLFRMVGCCFLKRKTRL